MDKEKIMALIFSDKDEKEVTKKLCKYFKKKPSLLDDLYPSNQNIFHLLVGKNRFLSLDALLKNETWRVKAFATDLAGASILHYAIRGSEKSANILDILIEQLPELLNIKNTIGNTPLHEAVIAENLWVVRRLVKDSRVDHSIKNATGDTAMVLAGNNNELRQALMYIDFSLIKPLDLRYRLKSNGSKEDLLGYFPLLSSANHRPDLTASSSISSSPDTSHSPLRLHESSSLELGYYDLKGLSDESDVQVVSTHKIISLLRKLKSAYKKNNQSSSYHKLQEEFRTLCEKSSLTDDFDLQKENLQTPDVKEVIFQTMSSLAPALDKCTVLIQNRTYNLLKIFVHILASNDLLIDAAPRELPQLSMQDENEAELLNLLWLLTACQNAAASNRQFNVDGITFRALGLLSSFSFTDILIGLGTLYPNFDRGQKLIANFIILQLLSYHTTDKIHLESKAGLQIQFMCELNSDSMDGLGELGKQINQYLEAALELNSLFSHHPLLRNFSILNRQINHPGFTQANDSFDALVNRALSLQKAARVAEVSLIAQELRMLTITFYQQVSIDEFRNGVWLKKRAQQNAPHITALTTLFNKLNSYFIEKILAQPVDNMRNSLQCLVEVAQALCPLDGEKYPDLHHLMLLSSIFNNISISRLTEVLNDLPSKDKRIIEEINLMVSTNQNFKFMREVYGIYRTALPFLGNVLSDVTFANESKTTEGPSLLGAEAVGSVLKQLIEIKLLVNFEGSCLRTNLPDFFAAYKPPSEDALYSASLRHQSRKTDVLNLDKATEVTPLLDDLTKNYLSQNILPSVLFNREQHAPSQLAALLINWFTKKVQIMNKAIKHNSSTDDHSEEREEFHGALDKLKSVVRNAIKINNKFYYPQGLSARINSLIYIEQLAHLGLLINGSEKSSVDDLEEKPKNRKSLLRRMSGFFGDKGSILPTPKKTNHDASSNPDVETSTQINTPGQ